MASLMLNYDELSVSLSLFALTLGLRLSRSDGDEKRSQIHELMM